ncbi:MAG: orotidine-5'-phosphate decarboxylase [Candidatus Falkowbacteria bacterium]
MEIKHNFVQLAEVQREQKTLYCGGLDPHSFGEKNWEIYGHATDEIVGFYSRLSRLSGLLGDVADKYAEVLAAVEQYTCHIVEALVELCNIRVFKPQASFYEQFGPAGCFVLMRVRNFIKQLEKKKGIRLICLLDCKRGDISTTQSCYFLGLMGNLQEDWGVDFAPYDFDIINVTPWMGSDVMVLTDDKGNPDRGLKLMRQGKGIIGVSKSSNPSSPEYQELYAPLRGTTVHLCHVEDSARWSRDFGLEYDGLSTIGLVVGSTYLCNGRIRSIFPGTTLLVPGFGAQGGDFSLIMLELIHKGKWNGQGAIFSSSRGTMYAFLKKYGGSGEIANLEKDLVVAVKKFRESEHEAFQTQEVKTAGIKYPF